MDPLASTSSALHGLWASAGSLVSSVVSSSSIGVGGVRGVRGGSSGSGGVPLAERRRVVLFKAFAEWPHRTVTRRLLLVGLVDGFQILEVGAGGTTTLLAAHSDAPVLGGGEYEPLLNQPAAASTPIGMLAMITHPDAWVPSKPAASTTVAPSSTGPYYGALVAVCSGEDRAHFPRSVLKIYSLPLGRYVHLLRFRSRILGVHVHPATRHLVVALDQEIHVYTTPTDGHSLAFECIWSTRTLPNPGPHVLPALQACLASGPGGAGANTAAASATQNLLATSTLSKEEWSVAALASRWLAYCPYEPLPVGQVPAAIFGETALEAHHPLPQASAAAGADSLSNVAKGIASGLYNLGGMGKLAMANYLSGDSAAGAAGVPHSGQISTSPEVPSVSASVSASSSSASSILGTVLVRDLLTQRVIASIRAHPATQITHLAWDRSGTLLATVPQDGQYVHVYQVAMVPQPQPPVGTCGATPGILPGSKDHSPLQSVRRSSVSTHSPLLAPTSGPAGSLTAPAPPLPTYQTRFLYRLFRGITHASVRSVSFSFDSKLVCLVSTAGTAHVFAIAPTTGGEPIVVNEQGLDENAATQQMVTKYSVLARATEHAGPEADAHAAMDGFLYQPRVLSALARIKPTGAPPTAFATGHHFATHTYLPVVATFERLDHLPQTSSSAASSHHLLVHTWSDELVTYALSTASSSSSGSSSSNDPDTTQRPKLALIVEPLTSVDLHGQLTHNASASGSSGLSGGVLNATNYSASRRGSYLQQQPHLLAQQQSSDASMGHEDEQPTVRILTQRGQEDEYQHTAYNPHIQPHLQYQQQQSQRSASPMLRGRVSPSPMAPIGFFQQLEAEHLHAATATTAGVRNSQSISPSLGPQHPHQQPQSAISHSPIFLALASGPAVPTNDSSGRSSRGPGDSPPLDPQAAVALQHAQASRWLSEVELRTYQSSEVPLWASPQFALKTYASAPGSGSGAGSSELYIERAGSKPLPYDKFASFAGLSVRTDIDGALSSSAGSAVPAADDIMEGAISDALASSMLDDAGFVASLRSRETRRGRGGSDQDGHQSAFIPDPRAQGGGGGASSGTFGVMGIGASGQLMSGIDEDYYAKNAGSSLSSVPTGEVDVSSPARVSPSSTTGAAHGGLLASHSASSILLGRMPPPAGHHSETDTASPPNVPSPDQDVAPPAAVSKKSKKKAAKKLRVAELDEDD